jgi:beta-galactosidase
MKLFALAALALTTAALAQSPATPASTTPGTPPGLYLGVAWYPEQWPESRWDADLTLMEQAHIRFVRVAEFAWARMEPTEGHYDLDWLDRAIRLAEKHHIAVVLGTPTATPPAWLSQKYPTILRYKEDGKQDEHGNRQHFNFADPTYRKFAAAIAAAMAKRFGHDPNILGWQIDNEYANASYGPAERTLFQQWLKARYTTLDNLNARWTTQYWSQYYFDWSQIPIETTYGNPALLLDWRRFVSDTWRSYQKNQLDAIRANTGSPTGGLCPVGCNSDPRQFITTNMMGFFDAYDHYTVAQDLTFPAWDDYVGEGHLNPVSNGATHDLMRGLLRKNFWVMETQPGFVNWAPDNNSLDKGEVRAMAWHDIGHGADAVSYWQWRSALNGNEEYHGTLVGPDGTPVPLYSEVAQLGDEFAKATPALTGTMVQSDVAILHSYDSRWAVEFQQHNRAFNPIANLIDYYGALRAQAHSVDIVNPNVPLSQYKLIIAPALNLLSDTQAKNLIDYVNNGGHLVLTQRSAMKNIDNGLDTERQPGPLAALLGGRVEQYYALNSTVPISGDWGAGPTKVWAELLSTSAPDTQVLMRYGKSNGWLDNQPAAITRQIGKGRITYIGAALEGDQLTNAITWALKDASVTPEFGALPPGIDLYIRKDRTHEVWIVINFAKADTPAQTITLPEGFTNVLTNTPASTITLNRFDVTILQRPLK